MLVETTQKTKQLQEMARLEDIADLADCTALLECEDIDKRVDKFIDFMSDDIASLGLADFIGVAHGRSKHFSLFTPTLTYGTAKIYVKRDFPQNLEGVARYVFDAQRKFNGVIIV